MSEPAPPAGRIPDVFISHASEDKAEVADPLVALLGDRELVVWYDKTDIAVGDSIRKKVDEGLSRSRFGVLLLSKHFFAKPWAENEFDALWAREINGRKVLIPVWHGVTREDVVSFSSLLAARLAVSTDAGLDVVADAIAREVGLPGTVGGRDGATVGAGVEDLHDGLKDIRDRLDDALQGRYIIEQLIAEGERSVSFRARDLILRRRVAIKVMDTRNATREERSRRLDEFRGSMQLAAGLKHRNIKAVYSGSIDDDLPHVVQEYVAGLGLDRILRTTGIQPFQKVRNLAWEIGGALDYAHRKGYLHLNLRLAEILIDKEGQPVISPFRLHYEPGPGRADPRDGGLSLEQIKYQSPEQYGFWGPTASVSEASDQYTLGLIAYEMLIGRPAIRATTNWDIAAEKAKFLRSTPDPRKERPDCPAKLAEMILRMLKADPAKRYPRLNDARDALSRLKLGGNADQSEEDRALMSSAGQSYERFRDSASFFEAFYRNLFEASPSFLAMFPVHLEMQYYLLRETLELMLQFPSERKDEPTTLSRVAESHRRRGIEPAYYDQFVESLIRSVKDHDPAFRRPGAGAGIEAAWRATVGPAIAYMKANGSTA